MECQELAVSKVDIDEAVAIILFFSFDKLWKKRKNCHSPLKYPPFYRIFSFVHLHKTKWKKKRFLVVLFWLFTYTFLSFIAFVCSSIHTIWKIVRRKKNFFFSWFPWPLPPPPPIDLPLFFSSSHIIPISTCPHPPCHQVIYRHTPHPPLIFFSSLKNNTETHTTQKMIPTYRPLGWII